MQQVNRVRVFTSAEVTCPSPPNRTLLRGLQEQYKLRETLTGLRWNKSHETRALPEQRSGDMAMFGKRVRRIKPCPHIRNCPP